MDHSQIFIDNNHRCISICNLNRLRHVKDVTNSRTIGHVTQNKYYFMQQFAFIVVSIR